MSLILGTNSGFVLTAPTADPLSNNLISIEGNLAAGKFTTHRDASYIISEIGCFFGNFPTSSGMDVGIYSHDIGSDKPDTLLASASNTVSTGVGWKKLSIDYETEADTIYWIAIQIDGGVGTFRCDKDSGHEAEDRIVFTTPASYTSLPASWPASFSTNTYYLVAIYALYVSSALGRFLINIGDTWKEVVGEQINIGDAWKTVF